MGDNMKLYLSLRREIPDDVDLFDGVGLLKGEHPDMKHHISDEAELRNTEGYVRKICDLFYPKPVWYRTNDASTSFVNILKGDKYFFEKNPHFGIRGIRRILVCPETFTKEIQMIQTIRKDYDNLNIIFPFVNDVNQYCQAVKIAREAGYNGRIGIMAELPSAVLTLEDFIKEGVNYVVFGMNDLTDCMDGCSRKNSETEHLIYRDKSLKATKRLLSMVKWCDGVEYVLSGDISPSTVQLLKEVGFNSFAIPHHLLEKDNSYYSLIKDVKK